MSKPNHVFQTKPNSFRTKYDFFSKKQTEIKNLFCPPLLLCQCNVLTTVITYTPEELCNMLCLVHKRRVSFAVDLLVACRKKEILLQFCTRVQCFVCVKVYLSYLILTRFCWMCIKNGIWLVKILSPSVSKGLTGEQGRLWRTGLTSVDHGYKAAVENWELQ